MMSRLGPTHLTVIVGMILATIVGLKLMGGDLTEFLAFATTVLVGIGVVQVGDTKRSVNGNLSRAIDKFEQMANQAVTLAKEVPPPDK